MLLGDVDLVVCFFNTVTVLNFYCYCFFTIYYILLLFLFIFIFFKKALCVV